ncbi:hypothetical protein JA1_001277 [Spathaspora sp. JA1]|nr:hypothetical protein JA1_001277 [Spathaspora sp. JA1]
MDRSNILSGDEEEEFDDTEIETPARLTSVLRLDSETQQRVSPLNYTRFRTSKRSPLRHPPINASESIPPTGSNGDRNIVDFPHSPPSNLKFNSSALSSPAEQKGSGEAKSNEGSPLRKKIRRGVVRISSGVREKEPVGTTTSDNAGSLRKEIQTVVQPKEPELPIVEPAVTTSGTAGQSSRKHIRGLVQSTPSHTHPKESVLPVVEPVVASTSKSPPNKHIRRISRTPSDIRQKVPSLYSAEPTARSPHLADFSREIILERVNNTIDSLTQNKIRKKSPVKDKAEVYPPRKDTPKTEISFEEEPTLIWDHHRSEEPELVKNHWTEPEPEPELHVRHLNSPDLLDASTPLIERFSRKRDRSFNITTPAFDTAVSSPPEHSNWWPSSKWAKLRKIVLSKHIDRNEAINSPLLIAELGCKSKNELEKRYDFLASYKVRVTPKRKPHR